MFAAIKFLKDARLILRLNPDSSILSFPNYISVEGRQSHGKKFLLGRKLDAITDEIDCALLQGRSVGPSKNETFRQFELNLKVQLSKLLREQVYAIANDGNQVHTFPDVPLPLILQPREFQHVIDQ